MKYNIPILLTSSVITYDSGVALKNANDRIRLTIESLEQWLHMDSTLEIVICDGSNFDFGALVKEKFPLAKIECLNFENNQKLVATNGRGFGEGEIVRYAVENSQLISNAKCFSKCTAKLWVRNYAACLDSWNGNISLKGVFLSVFSLFRKTKFSYIDTRFYISSVEFYNQYLKDAHLKVNPENGYSLEDSFFDIINERRLRKVLFHTAPIIDGVGGGTGVYYKNPGYRNLKERFRLALVILNKEYRGLFTR